MVTASGCHSPISDSASATAAGYATLTYHSARPDRHRFICISEYARLLPGAAGPPAEAGCDVESAAPLAEHPPHPITAKKSAHPMTTRRRACIIPDLHGRFGGSHPKGSPEARTPSAVSQVYG